MRKLPRLILHLLQLIVHCGSHSKVIYVYSCSYSIQYLLHSPPLLMVKVTIVHFMLLQVLRCCVVRMKEAHICPLPSRYHPITPYVITRWEMQKQHLTVKIHNEDIKLYLHFYPGTHLDYHSVSHHWGNFLCTCNFLHLFCVTFVSFTLMQLFLTFRIITKTTTKETHHCLVFHV